jgi:hypothetical protein
MAVHFRAMPSFLASDCRRGAVGQLALEDVLDYFQSTGNGDVGLSTDDHRSKQRDARNGSGSQICEPRWTCKSARKGPSKAAGVRKSDGDVFRWKLAFLRTTPETIPPRGPIDRAFSRATSLRWPDPGPGTGGRGHFPRIGCCRHSWPTPPRERSSQSPDAAHDPTVCAGGRRVGRDPREENPLARIAAAAAVGQLTLEDILDHLQSTGDGESAILVDVRSAESLDRCGSDRTFQSRPSLRRSSNEQ